MPESRSIDIDHHLDLKIVRSLSSRKNKYV